MWRPSRDADSDSVGQAQTSPATQASKITVGGVKAFDYTALLMGAVLGDESGLRELGNMADPWNVEVPGLLDGPGRCLSSSPPDLLHHTEHFPTASACHRLCTQPSSCPTRCRLMFRLCFLRCKSEPFSQSASGALDVDHCRQMSLQHRLTEDLLRA